MKDKCGWYLITKSFHGGGFRYAFRLTRAIQKRFEDMDELLECIGERTDGGHNYGYRITTKFQREKPKEKTLRFVTREEMVTRLEVE